MWTNWISTLVKDSSVQLPYLKVLAKVKCNPLASIVSVLRRYWLCITCLSLRTLRENSFSAADTLIGFHLAIREDQSIPLAHHWFHIVEVQLSC